MRLLLQRLMMKPTGNSNNHDPSTHPSIHTNTRLQTIKQDKKIQAQGVLTLVSAPPGQGGIFEKGHLSKPHGYKLSTLYYRQVAKSIYNFQINNSFMCQKSQMLLGAPSLLCSAYHFIVSDNGSKGELWIGASTRANLGERKSQIHRGCEQLELSLKNAGPPPASTKVRKGEEGGRVPKIRFLQPSIER